MLLPLAILAVAQDPVPASEPSPPLAPLAVAPDESRVRFGGYFTLLYIDEDGENSTFDNVRFVPQLEVDLAPWMHFASEVEIEGGGADASFLTGNEILVEYAEFLFDLNEDWRFKVGDLLIPLGRYNRNHDDPFWELNDRPESSRRMAAVVFAQPGIGCEGSLPLGPLDAHLDLVLANGFDDGIGAAGGLRDGRQSFRADNNDGKTVFARVGLLPRATLLGGVLDLGVSGHQGNYDLANQLALRGHGVDASWTYGSWTLQGEWHEASPEGMASMAGGWAELDWRFADRWAFAVRRDALDTSADTIGSMPLDGRRAWEFGLSFRPRPETAFKIGFTLVDTAYVGADDIGNRLTLGLSTYF